MTNTSTGIRLRSLSMLGPACETASVSFGPGLNVIYGASDTGKSFLVEVIDFMLGGRPPLREIAEREGYDRILLGIEALSGECFTIERSVDGGAFRVHDGLHGAVPAEVADVRVLAEQHSDRNDANLSSFLLSLCGLSGKRIKKNAKGETNSLSFRNLAGLVIVTETEITQRRSPLLDENVISNTSNVSMFKLLLSGVDDSTLAVARAKQPEELSKSAQLELLDQLLSDYKQRLRVMERDPAELEAQLERIDASLQQHVTHLGTTEKAFQTVAKRRRDLRKKVEVGRDRLGELSSLTERFLLLSRHYSSDIDRLRGIEEGGTFLSIVPSGACPLCGAPPSSHDSNGDHPFDVTHIVRSAQKEIEKIEALERDLASTLADLSQERQSLERRIVAAEGDLMVLSGTIDTMLAPTLQKLRATYAEFADKRGQVREALSIYSTVTDLEGRKRALLGDHEDVGAASVPTDIPTALAARFSEYVENILTEWHFPEAGRVHFDGRTKDIVIGGTPRIARGKGLRAITHSAFTLALLAFCRDKNKSHPGFVILDSPLLAYREPDGKDDDLRGTDLKERFYAYLASIPEDQQVIVVENTDPPPSIALLPQVTRFGKNPKAGRYGFFPHLGSK